MHMSFYFYRSSPLSHLQTWHSFHISVKWVGYPLSPSHFVLMSPYTLSNGYSSNHPWWMMFVSSSQCYQVISSNMPKGLEIVWHELISLKSFSPFTHVLVFLYQLWSLYHIPLFCVDWWRINQCLPLTDFIMSTSTHYSGLKSRNSSIPWSLQSLVASVPMFNSDFSSLTHDQMTLHVFDINIFIHTT